MPPQDIVSHPRHVGHQSSRHSLCANSYVTYRLGHCPMSGLRPRSEKEQKSDLEADISVSDPGRVKTFSIFQELHAAGRDPRRRDHLSIFWLYRVWSQSGRNLGPR
jgi:hypothetical protein